MTLTHDSPPPRAHGHRTSLILIALVLGIVAGFVFGEYCVSLQVIGDAFVGLLQMTVLPYIVVSLIASFGKLSLLQSRRLISIGGAVLLTLWAIGLAAVYVVPHSFPVWKAGSFFSTAAIEPAVKPDWVPLFIPGNVFGALAENQIPAVVVFCIAVGLALGAIPQKDALVDQLDVLGKSLIHVSSFVARMTPLGIFAIAASTSGTFSLDELERLQAYLVIYGVSSMFVMFVVLPCLIATCTPFRYRDIWAVSRDAVVTALVTGKLIVVLPMLIEETERLFGRTGHDEPSNGDPTVEVLYPLAYPFPHLGKLMAMLFIPFAAWFLGHAMRDQEYPRFLIAGLVSYFGGPLIATPFLLDLMHLPHDMFSLFLISGVVCGRLGDALGVMHLVAFTLLTSCAYRGTLRLPRFALLRYFVIMGLISVAMVAGLRTGLGRTIKSLEAKEDVLHRMHLLSEKVEAEVMTVMGPNPDPLRPGETLLDRIRRRGVIRIGYNEDKLPFAYFNINGDLVGFDINMAHLLARDLDARIEFVRFDRARVAQQLNADHFDVVMSGLAGTLERAEAMLHTKSYMDVTLSLTVPDYRAQEFATLADVRKLGKIQIGFVEISGAFAGELLAFFPEITLVKLSSNREYFEGAWRKLDGLLISAESGSAFSLEYPDFEVVVPEGARVSIPLFYAVGARDVTTRDFLEHWLELRKRDGTIRNMYDYWILGKLQPDPTPRWSLIRYLGWVD